MAICPYMDIMYLGHLSTSFVSENLQSYTFVLLVQRNPVHMGGTAPACVVLQDMVTG